MQYFIHTIIRLFAKTSTKRSRTTTNRRTILGVETLEGRDLPSSALLLAPVSSHYPTDPCAVAVVHPADKVTLNPQPLPPGVVLHAVSLVH